MMTLGAANRLANALIGPFVDELSGTEELLTNFIYEFFLAESECREMREIEGVFKEKESA